ncbi:MAG: aminotransferase class I/II-fold pyridoxal phosphate-dependent enzyme [Bifidobacteriaceae bacterium]|nr:aminotransferase class I/II-fold pyridoxal phosphate-dependent enzyme [Bifidobacteriaceae bacterium]
MAELISRMTHFPETIFSTMTRLAQERGAINLGQGFPDESGPESMLRRAQEEIARGNNQYAPGRGFTELREAVAADRGGFYDPETEILITVGATEGIAASILALVEPGQEVIVIEPYYDEYAAIIALAGANMVPVPLDENLRPDIPAIREAITPKTAALIINTPHNPTGIMFSLAELQAIADLAQEADLLVIADEVYEKFGFDGRRHAKIAELAGMKERTVTVSSAAKMLSVTGWKTGWVMATKEHIDAILMVKQYLSFVGVSHVQPAIAAALREEQEWIADLGRRIERRRDILRDALEKAGYPTYGAEGGYFIVADVGQDAEEFCLGELVDKGIVGIPVSAFVSSEVGKTRFSRLVRFALCRPDADIEAAVNLLVN